MGNVTGSADAQPGVVETESEFNDMDCDQRFLEDILKMYRLDLDNPEMYDIFKHVKKRLWKSVKHLKDTSLEVEDIVMVGSMAEDARIWDYSGDMIDMGLPMIEFNFLAVLKMPAREWTHVLGCVCPDRTKIAKTVKNCEGHRLVLSHIHIKQSADCECVDEIYEKRNKNLLCRKCLRTKFRKEVLRKLMSEDEKSSLKFQQNCLLVSEKWDTKYPFLWPAMGAFTAPSMYHAMDEKSLKIVSVHVDFMPVFLYQDYDAGMSCKTIDEQKSEEHDIYLLPKSDCGHRTCFRISCSKNEVRVLGETSQAHRDAYMALKVLLRCDPVDKVVRAHATVPTYILKTVVLNHVAKCQRATLVDCVGNVLSELLDSFRRRKLISFDGEVNLLSIYAQQENKAELQQYKERVKLLLLFLASTHQMERREYDISSFLFSIGINP